MRTVFLRFLVLGLGSLFITARSEAKPKYASTTVRAIDSSEYMRTNAAPDFWAQIYHYVPQGENMCQTASMAMIFNALKNKDAGTSETKNITQAEIVERVNDAEWVKAMKEKKCFSLDRFGELLKKALGVYFGEQYGIRLVHVDGNDSTSTYLKDFSSNEKSSDDFIIANFDQAIFTGESHTVLGTVH